MGKTAEFFSRWIKFMIGADLMFWRKYFRDEKSLVLYFVVLRKGAHGLPTAPLAHCQTRPEMTWPPQGDRSGPLYKQQSLQRDSQSEG